MSEPPEQNSQPGDQEVPADAGWAPARLPGRSNGEAGGPEEVRTPKLVPRVGRPEGPAPVLRYRTPKDPTPLPPEGGLADLDDPLYYLNRELTWLNFNFRVLHEAEDPRTPLLERVKFVSIVGSNLDEFFMKRIGGLKHQVEAGITERTVDGRTPEEQVRECRAVVERLEDRQRAAIATLQAHLADEDIRVVDFADLDKPERKRIRKHYLKNIYPLVTPQATDPAHPFPFVSNLSLNLLVTLRYPDEETTHLARVKVPVGAGITRFIHVHDTNAWVTLESVMADNLDILFPGMEIVACELFRVTRNAIYDVNEDMADDLLDVVEAGLRSRRLAPIVRLQVQRGMDVDRLGMLTAELGLTADDVYEGVGPLGMRDLMELATLPRPELRDVPYSAALHP
ncbi:MAG: RNA degradosome polyphosphate kinase, partial [Gemmatimonadetes bacterium]|nr:RNA degradosome polyphosphate kinase [Gemmatimonadota bacterium]